MNDSKSGLRPAPASFGLKKAIACLEGSQAAILIAANQIPLAPRYLALIRSAQQALHRATDQTSTAAERGAALADWQAAAERLAVALVAYLESIEEDRP
ncbi:hypothetical protein E0E50_15180 [Azotobacter chroococcum subsp. isscasi]|uniref:hypothetical protein n=1 Tax=Azotobacter chroococcum TaxID=353 RepID=UPI00103C1882|nr:hypothetical protein [Azotobacter chroococcum]TBW08300.1 hypothetical protein E0E50_15180 [Azotobacter chroococcum subsp. isscasi]